jgi:hypothetical protein
MLFFKRMKKPNTPAKATQFREETHVAAVEATKSLKKLNKVMNNGITINIYHAMRDGHGR